MTPSFSFLAELKMQIETAKNIAQKYMRSQPKKVCICLGNLALDRLEQESVSLHHLSLELPVMQHR